MTDPLVPADNGHTAISDEHREELVPSYIASRGELFAAEEANIAAATFRLHPSSSELLDDLYLRRLHRAMFEQVWKWAGRYRVRETNIGVDPAHIQVQVRELLDSTTLWVAEGTFEPDVIAVRFHHRLVQIHPFVNGNGRHGRIAADLLVRSFDRASFGWGRGLGLETNELRARYREALQRADADPEDIRDLVEFARS